MKAMTGQLLGSKKAWGTLSMILVWVIGRFGADVPAEELLPLVGAIATFVLAQGWADKGKEAVKEKAKLDAMDSNGEPKPDFVS